MYYFIGRNKYFSFIENIKEDNKVNKLSLRVLNTPDEPAENILATSSKVQPYVDLNYGENVYPLKVANGANVSISYQSTSQELNKYGNVIYYRIMALPVYVRKDTVAYDYDSIIFWEEDRSETSFQTLYGSSFQSSKENCSETDWVEISSATCNISSSYVVSLNTVVSNTITPYKSDVVGKQYLGFYWTHMFGEAKYYTDIYVEIYGKRAETSYSNIIKEQDINNRIKYNYSFEENTFIQNHTRYLGEPIIDYISDTIFKNYGNGRPVATLEWIGSPEVDVGTDLKIEPRRNYTEDELITYTVVGKDISYNGGYREKLYLIKKEAD
jgi:hypothetical protein